MVEGATLSNWPLPLPIRIKMNKRFSIVNKGLLLVATPLTILAIFIGMLIQAQVEGANAQEWAVHTKEVIARVDEIYRRLLEGYAGIRILVVSDNPAIGWPVRAAPPAMPDPIEELKFLISDNDKQKPRIDMIASQSRTFRDWLASEERLLQSGERGKALDGLDEGARLLGVVRTTVDDVLAMEDRLDSDRMGRLRRSTVRQLWTVIGGGIAFLCTTLLLSLFFLNDVIRRLAVLRDNARRFAEGKGLMAPLTGSDEIAEVDRAFHDMATSLDQQKQENEMFVYSVSHDLRSPLINLQGFSEELSLSCRDLQVLWQHEEVPPAVREDGKKLMSENIEVSIHYIQTAVGRLARIIDALLRLSRAGRVEYQCQTLDLETIVRKIVDALHDTITDKGAELSVRELPPAWGDPTAVEQIFANLIGNAVHYLDGAKSGKVEVGSTGLAPSGTMPGFRVYYVKDNGLGIPEAYHQRVFTAFSRLHANVAQGEGIGLALVRRMVERHGGRIWLESAAGAGTTFYVALPARAPDGDRGQVAERPPVAQAPRGEQPAWQPSRS
jgi:signal transduction histidine kinase